MADICFICESIIKNGEIVAMYKPSPRVTISAHVGCVKRKIEAGEDIIARTIEVDPDSTCTMEIGDAGE